MSTFYEIQRTFLSPHRLYTSKYYIQSNVDIKSLDNMEIITSIDTLAYYLMRINPSRLLCFLCRFQVVNIRAFGKTRSESDCVDVACAGAPAEYRPCHIRAPGTSIALLTLKLFCPFRHSQQRRPQARPGTIDVLLHEKLRQPPL